MSASGHELTVRELAAMRHAATTIRVGAIETGHGVYQAVGRYVEAHHFRLAGPSREVLLQPPGPAGEAVTEIQVPIAERESP
jgi:effector-binding domain-containing protein